MTPLTARQIEVVNTIRAFIAEHGYPPTVRELGCLLDISTPNGVVCHLRALEKKGALLMQPLKSRGMKLLCDEPKENSVTLTFAQKQIDRLYDIAHAKGLTVAALCQKVLLKALENAK